MEAWTIFAYRQAVFSHLTVKHLHGIRKIRRDRILRTRCQTPSTADTLLMIYMRLTVLYDRSSVCTYSVTCATTYADRRIHARFTFIMLLHFTCSRTTSHSDILQRSTKSGCFMSLKMCQRDKHIRIHDCLPDLRLFHILTVNRNQCLISSLQAISNDHMTSRLIRRESINVCRLQMVKGILPAAYIQRIAIRQEWFASQFLHIISHYSGIVRPQECQVAILPEMNLDRHILIGEINLLKPGCLHQTMHLLQKVLMRCRLERCKIYICFLHSNNQPFSACDICCHKAPIYL